MKTPKVIYPVVVSIVSLFFAMPMIEARQEINATQQPIIARTIQNSSAVITLRFTFDNGESIQVSQKDGSMIRVERNKQILGFTPYLPKGGDGPVALRVFQIERIIKNGKFVGEAMIEQKNFDDLTQSFVDYRVDDLTSSIQLMEVRAGIKTQQKEVDTNSGVDPMSGCCVTCNGVKICACAVTAGCGSCCVGDCC